MLSFRSFLDIKLYLLIVPHWIENRYKLPSIFQNFGLQLHSVENDAPLSAGGSGVATMMKMSTVQLAQKYIATGEATDEDVQKYCRFAENPSSWAVYYATVGVIGQKVEEKS